MRLGFNPPKQEKIWLLVVMTAGLINGLLHAFIVPPWQHYDEPGNFEYAWLIANRPGLPEVGEYDQSMHREVAASMIEHDFFANLNFRPNLLSMSEPVWIGISQVDDVPLYYMLVSLPLSIFRYSDVTFQLYLCRLVSLGLFLITIISAYAITAEMTESGSPLRILVPFTVAMIPAFVDIMSAVNNDVGAAAFFTMFLWLCVRMLRRKVTWLNTILLILLVIICLYTKSTTIFVIPLVFLVLILALLPQPKRIYGWGAFFVLAVVILIIGITFDGIAGWHALTPGNQMIRTHSQVTPYGEYALEIRSPIESSRFTAVQLLPNTQVENLRGRMITVGVWMWASSPVQARTPIMDDGSHYYFETVSLGTNPEFFVYSMEVADQPGSLMLKLQTNHQPGDDRVSVFFDGIVLVEGDLTQEGSPAFFDIKGSTVEWGAYSLSNYLRNASFEQAAPQLRPQFEAIISTYLPVRLSNVIGSFFDLEVFRSYYSITIQFLFRTFWAVFGWGEVYLVGSKPYRLLLIITLIAIIGDAFFVWRKRRELPLHTLGFLGFATVGVWLMVALRGINSVFSNLWIPSARYAYPVIVPSVLLLVVGWKEILNVIGESINIPQILHNAGIITFLLILNVISFYSIWLYYYAK